MKTPLRVVGLTHYASLFDVDGKLVATRMSLEDAQRFADLANTPAVPPAPPEEGIDLNRRGKLERMIVGELRNCIDTHGNISAGTAPSAAKRIIGAIKQFNRQAREAGGVS